MKCPDGSIYTACFYELLGSDPTMESSPEHAVPADESQLSAKEKHRLKMQEKKLQLQKPKKGAAQSTAGANAAAQDKSRTKSKASRVGKGKQKVMEKEAQKKELARRNFNTHYQKQFGVNRWNKLLPALEGPTRYCCLVNKYASESTVDTALAALRPKLEQLPFIGGKCYAVKLTSDQFDPAATMEELMPFPQPAKDEENGVLNYYLLDAASLLPVEALGVQPNDTVLDLCAAPGGKSLAILQKLRLGEGCVGSLTSNEISAERRKRLKAVIHGYLPQELHSYVTVSGKDATQWHLTEGSHYDRVLVDAPCSSDRHVLHDPAEMATWSASRSKINAQRQYLILQSALKAVRVGGTVVYATCALNQTENDDVVEKVLKKSRVIVQLDTSKRWEVGEPTKFGWIVLPDNGQGWGPLYFAVLKRGAGERAPANKRREIDDSDEDNDEELDEPTDEDASEDEEDDEAADDSDE